MFWFSTIHGRNTLAISVAREAAVLYTSHLPQQVFTRMLTPTTYRKKNHQKRNDFSNGLYANSLIK